MPESDPDLLDSLLERIQERTADSLDRRMRDADAIKAHEEAASQQRLEEMWFREHERQRSVAESQAEQRRQEQRLVRLAAIAAALIVLAVIILTIVLNVLP